MFKKNHNNASHINNIIRSLHYLYITLIYIYIYIDNDNTSRIPDSTQHTHLLHIYAANAYQIEIVLTPNIT